MDVMDKAGIEITLDLTGTPLRRTVLAMGADMKNAVAAGTDRQVLLTPVIGSLDTPETVERFEHAARSLPDRLGITPDTIAIDLHPDMQASRFGRKLAKDLNLPLVEVQHHHAHAAACLAENGARAGYVLVMDGTGWGGDGTIWGSELLDVKDDGTVRRAASYVPVPLPGGDAAVSRPARQVIGRWVQAGLSLTDQRLSTLGVTPEEADVWGLQCRRQVNAPLTHSAGRLFDAFCAVLDLAPRNITYEGEPAIRLEAAAREWRGGDIPVLPFDVHEQNRLLLIDWAPAFLMLADLKEARRDSRRWAMAVHVAIARAAGIMIESAVSGDVIKCVGLSGGVFMNRILNDLLDQHLDRFGITALRHRKTLPGDGCIALGQVVVAGWA